MRKIHQRNVQKNRMQTLKYKITAPQILKLGFPCAIFSGIVTLIFALSQIYHWRYFKQVADVKFMGICLLTFGGFTVLGMILAAYGYIWKLEYDEQEIRCRSIFGIVKHYKIDDITRYTTKRNHKYKFYCGERKLFQYEMDAEGDIYHLLNILQKKGLYPEQLIPSQTEYCIIEPMMVQKILPLLSLLCFSVFMIIISISGIREMWIYLLLIGVIAGSAYYTVDYFCDKVELVGNKIYRRQFLQKTRQINMFDIVNVHTYRSIAGKEYFLIIVKDDRPLKIRKYNENVNILIGRLKQEKIVIE